MKGDKYFVTSVGNSWYIVNERTERRKRIGPVQLKGINYFDRAKAEAGRRMGVPAEDAEYKPYYFGH